MKKQIVLWMLFLFVSLAVCGQEETIEKINGLSLVAERTALDTSEVDPILSIGANWAAIIPFGFMEDAQKPRLAFNGKWQWYGERIDGAREGIQALHLKGISVMLKPQLWVSHGVYTGEVQMTSEGNWKKLEESYTIFIRAFAELAEQEHVEMLCIGTELTQFTGQRPDFWRRLIKEIRSIYSGKLTYAANWDEYTDVVFWDDLDYIGVDAYFPIADSLGADEEALKRGWSKWITEINELSERFSKKILFTEFGYRSISECAINPWEYNSASAVDEDAQSMALAALFSETWNLPIMAGGFLWKWHADHKNAGGAVDNMFTVQNKKAEEIVRSVYLRK